MKTTTIRSFAIAAASAALLLAGCGSDPGSAGGDGELAGAQLTVGSKEFTESIILGQITALVFENAGAQVTDQTGLQGSATVREALMSKEIDIYWDYTGTGWVNILGNSSENLPEDLFTAVKEADAANGVAWLPPANFENAYRVAAAEDFAAEHNLATTSDAAAFVNANPDQGTICAASEFINRDDGLPGLEDAYEFTFSEVVELDFNLIFTQVGTACQFGEVFSTDARIISNNLRVLDDDRSFFVPYQGAVTLRQETLDQHPAIADLLAPVSQALTEPVITELNGKVDNDGERPRKVAEEWLAAQGFIG
ncbi:MAG: glycine betaine ABC transporter substrate-binding protein [Propionicimonas sp.]